MPDGRGGLVEQVAPIDDGGEFAGLDEFGEDAQVLRVLRGDEAAQILADEPVQQQRSELTVDAAEPPSTGASVIARVWAATA